MRTSAVGASSIGASSVARSVSPAPARLLALTAPDRAALAVVTVDAPGLMSLFLMTDGGVSAPLAVDSLVPLGTAGAAYAVPSSHLVLLSGAAGSSVLDVRTYDGSALSGAAAAPLGLSSEPVRVVARSRASSDQVLIVAASGAELAATVWDSGAFRSTQTLDASYDGGAGRFDAVWTRWGTPLVAWARTGDVALRVSRLSGGAWSAMTGTPVAPGAISGVVVAADPRERSDHAAAGMISGSGRLDVAAVEHGAWSSAALVASTVDLAADAPAALAFEGSGGALTAAWLSPGSSAVSVSRRPEGGAWSGASQTAALAAGLEEVALAPVDSEAATVLLARATAEGSGGGPAVADYSLYSETNIVLQGTDNQYAGLVGSQAAGVLIPDPLAASAGSTNITVGQDASRTLTPGNYRDLNFGDRSRITFDGAGTYVFRRLTLSGVDCRWTCVTGSGDITIIFMQGETEFRDGWIVERTGSGAVALHTVAGNFKMGHDGRMDFVLSVHAGEIKMGDRNQISGHMFARDLIDIGHENIFAAPSWAYPGSGGTQTLHEAFGLLVSASGPGSPVALMSAPVEGDAAPPMAAPEPAASHAPAIVRWREVGAE
ncbi:MAG: hypothetical protein SFZ24_12970 [Planctomycetota bacterium]|nr:hypothetical protein [Planctomycetota bacterium]